MSLFVLIPLVGGLWLVVLAGVLTVCAAAGRAEALYLQGVHAERPRHTLSSPRRARRPVDCGTAPRALRGRSALG
jgi:hypothetical protein